MSHRALFPGISSRTAHWGKQPRWPCRKFRQGSPRRNVCPAPSFKAPLPSAPFRTRIPDGRERDPALSRFPPILLSLAWGGCGILSRATTRHRGAALCRHKIYLGPEHGGAACGRRDQATNGRPDTTGFPLGVGHGERARSPLGKLDASRGKGMPSEDKQTIGGRAVRGDDGGRFGGSCRLWHGLLPDHHRMGRARGLGRPWRARRIALRIHRPGSAPERTP